MFAGRLQAMTRLGIFVQPTLLGFDRQKLHVDQLIEDPVEFRAVRLKVLTPIQQPLGLGFEAYLGNVNGLVVHTRRDGLVRDCDLDRGLRRSFAPRQDQSQR
jgi:hypothetical protein